MRKNIVAAALFLLWPTALLASDFTGQANLAGKGAAHNAVISLEGAKKGTPIARAMVDQRDKTFIPHVSCVTVGTVVEFPNNDTVFHNVFSYYNAKKIELGVYPHGATKRETLDKAGVVALLCNIHSDMSAYIVVVDTPYFAVTDKKGSFRIKDVPPGTYTLHAWHESGAIFTQQITIGAATPPAALTLARK